MPDFTVYSIPGSPFGQAVLATLGEKHAGWRLVPTPPAELKGAEHLARNPFGRVPVLEHDGFLLYETQAIIRYIDRVLPEPKLTPADPRRAARMDQLLAISDWYVFNGVASVIVFERVVRPYFGYGEPDLAAVDAAMPKGCHAFAELSRLLGGQAFFTGEALSLADLHLAAMMAVLAMTPEWEKLVGGHENLAAWYARMAARPSMAETTLQKLTAAG